MDTEITAGAATPSGGIGFFEKWLSVWVALCIAAGIGLGTVMLSLVAFANRTRGLFGY